MLKLKRIWISIGFLFLISACDESKEDVSVDSEVLEIQELETLLDERKFNEFLTELNSLENSNNEQLTVLGDRLGDILINENDVEFVRLNFEDIIGSNLLSDITKAKIRKLINDQKNLLLDEMEQNIREGSALTTIKVYEQNELIHDNKEGNVLYKYALFKRNKSNDYLKAIIQLAKDVSPSYSGRLSEEIREEFTKEGIANLSKEAWKHYYEENQKSDVFIGMTSDEVLKSKWGEPRKINRTTTAYGVREQWVYEGYKYLYFEDGILTTIQN